MPLHERGLEKVDSEVIEQVVKQHAFILSGGLKEACCDLIGVVFGGKWRPLHACYTSNLGQMLGANGFAHVGFKELMNEPLHASPPFSGSMCGCWSCGLPKERRIADKTNAPGDPDRRQSFLK